jgi:hypothetical protein
MVFAALGRGLDNGKWAPFFFVHKSKILPKCLT